MFIFTQPLHYQQKRACLRGIVTDVLDCDIVVSEFELQPRY